MVECTNSGFKVGGGVFPPWIYAGYVTNEKLNDECVPTINGVAIGTNNKFDGNLRGVSIGGYNQYREVDGLLIGLINAGGQMRGIQVGVENFATQEIEGATLALWINESDGEMNGFDISFMNLSRDMSGVQVSLQNMANRNMKGVQLAVFGNGASVNETGTMEGVQIAGANICEHGSMSGINIGLVNTSNQDMKGLQIAAWNIILGNGSMYGAQAAIMANLAGNNMEGVQVAIFANSAATGSMEWPKIAIANIAPDSCEGFNFIVGGGFCMLGAVD